jgi:outer membrane protein assembly factor BamD
MKLILLLSLVSLFWSNGCKKDNLNTLPDESASETEYYENGVLLLKKNVEKGRLILKQVIQLYPTSIYAQKAKISIADSYVKKNDPASLIVAVSEYQEYLGLYPNSPDAIYAKYQIGMCYFLQMKKPGRDQTNTVAAIKAFESLIRQFPDTRESEMAQQNIIKAKENMAEHIFQIGKSNVLVKSFQGAINRFKEVMDQYPKFSKMDQLLYLTGRSHRGLNEVETARSFFQQVMERYPQSPFSKKARKELIRLPASTGQ